MIKVAEKYHLHSKELIGDENCRFFSLFLTKSYSMIKKKEYFCLGLLITGLLGVSLFNRAIAKTTNVNIQFAEEYWQQLRYVADAPNIFEKIFGRVVKKDIPFEDQITWENTTYVIKNDFDLQGKDVTVPRNCILKFKGGSLSNGTITGQRTKIVYNTTIFCNISVAGTWAIPVVNSWMFKDIEQEDKLRLLFDLCSSDIQNDVYIEKNENPYIIVPRGNAWYSSTGISIPSYTNIHNNATIKIKPNGNWRYCIFAIDASSHILIEGGEYVGDKKEHDYSDQSHPTHEWGYAIWSYRGSDAITIRNGHFHDFTGDAIELNSRNATIDRVVIHDNRRQGISLCDCSFVTISNFEIYNIGLSGSEALSFNGTNPRAAIDIEPNNVDAHDITIENGVIYNCHRGLICSNTSHSIYNNTYRNIKINNVIRPIRHFTATDCIYDGIMIAGAEGEQEKGSSVKAACLFYDTNNVQITNSSIKVNDDSNAYAFFISSGDAGCAINYSYIEANSPFNVKNTTVSNCNIICSSGVGGGAFIKNSRIQIERRTPVAATSFAASLDNCDVYVSNHLLIYDISVSNCRFVVDSSLTKEVFILATNSNPIFNNSKITVTAANILFSNTVSGSSLNLVNCSLDLIPGCSYGSNINKVFWRQGETVVPMARAFDHIKISR